MIEAGIYYEEHHNRKKLYHYYNIISDICHTTIRGVATVLKTA